MSYIIEQFLHFLVVFFARFGFDAAAALSGFIPPAKNTRLPMWPMTFQSNVSPVPPYLSGSKASSKTASVKKLSALSMSV